MAKNEVGIRIAARDATAKAFASVQRRLAATSKAARQVANTAGRAGLASATVAAGALAALTKASMENLDAVSKMSDRLGVTTEALTGFHHAAELSGVEASVFNKALQQMGVQISNAAQGTGVAKKSLEQLGLSAAALETLPLDEQMYRVADALQNVTNHTDKVRIATELFGARGAGLLVMMQNGSAGMRAMAAEAERLGITISRVDGAQIEAANDAVTRAKSVFTGLGNQLATAFSPLIAEVATNFYQAALDSEAFGDIGNRVAKSLVKGYAYVADGVQGIKWLLYGAGAAWAAFAEMGLNAASFITRAFDLPIAIWNKFASLTGLPQIENSISQVLGAMAAEAGELKNTMLSEFNAIATAPLPSEGINNWYEEVKAKARETAEVISANAPATVIRENFEENGPVITDLALTANSSIQDVLGTLITTTQSQMQTLGGIFEEGSAMGKAFYVVNQVMAAGMAVVNGFKAATAIKAAYAEMAAITGNVGLIGVGDAHASMAIGMGFASAGAIMGQTIASFDGGGYIGGIRAGGMDSKGGRLAMLHSGEYVVPEDKMGLPEFGGGTNVNITIQAADTKDFDRLLNERRGMISSLVAKALANQGRRLA